MNIDYINTLAPDHDRLSCREDNPNFNAKFAPDDLGSCYRCTLLKVAREAVFDYVEKKQVRGAVAENHLREIVAFAYLNGFHELGYDPVSTLYGKKSVFERGDKE